MSHSEYQLLSSERLEAVFGQRLESRRLASNISQAQLAAKAGVSRRTISRLENGEGVSLDTFIRVARQLGLVDHLLAGLPEQDVVPMDRVRLKGKQRKRARPPKTSSSSAADSATPWTWGDEPEQDN